MITEDYVSFDTAKLLEEKGFDEPCHALYHDGDDKIFFGLDEDSYLNSIMNTGYYTCPTLQMVMKWLREVYGIYPDIAVEEIDDNTTFFRVDGIYLKQMKMWDKYNNLFKTYEEACEAAIKYCLENFI